MQANATPLRHRFSLVALVSVTLVATGCSSMSERERGTAQGAGAGAVAGAVIGSITGGSAGRGAVIGGAVGAVAGNLWSKRMEEKRAALERASEGTGVQVARTDDNRLKLNVPSDVSFDTGRADMNTLFDASQAFQIGDRKIKDFHAQNWVMTLEEAYLHSSNIGTSQLAVQMGPNTMRDYFRRLGLLDAAKIELKESAKPVVPRRWDNSTLASLSFGYGIMITPAQMVQAMGALTNGGRMIPLSLRKGGARNVQPQQVVTEETSRAILDLLRRNVVKGSGGFADAPGLRVGGKTGSANKLVGGRYDPSHALGSFAAVFPVDGPLNGKRYAILIVMDEPGTYPKTGAYVAAPAVHNIADRIAGFLGVERRDDRWRTASGEKIPQYQDVAGDGL